MTIVAASSNLHDTILLLAKQHKATNAFGHFMFSGEEAYRKGWIRVMLGPDGTVLGATCVRHKVRQPKTSLYYIMVAKEHKRAGIGQALLDDLVKTSPHRCLELSCLKDNEAALAFYAKNGFVQTGDSLKGKGWHLEKNW